MLSKTPSAFRGPLRLVAVMGVALCMSGTTQAAYLQADFATATNLGAKKRFNSVVRLSVGNTYASGVMLSPTIGITAASALPTSNASITVSGKGSNQTLSNKNWVIHEDFQRNVGFGNHSDLAMFKLAEPIAGLNYANVKRLGGEEGLNMTYVGHIRGDFSGRLPGPAGSRIGFKNVIDGDPAGSLFMIDRDLRFKSEHKFAGQIKSTYGDARVLPQEGALRAKESGGGAFVKNGKGNWKLAGIGSYGDSTASLTHPLASNRISGFTRLSMFTPWIDQRLESDWWDDYLGVLEPQTPEVTTIAPIDPATPSSSIGGGLMSTEKVTPTLLPLTRPTPYVPVPSAFTLHDTSAACAVECPEPSALASLVLVIASTLGLRRLQTS